jgi:hypothetical protein
MEEAGVTLICQEITAEFMSPGDTKPAAFHTSLSSPAGCGEALSHSLFD